MADRIFNSCGSNVVQYLKDITPKTEEEMVEEFKNFIQDNDPTTIKDIKKALCDICKQYDYKNICEDILKKFGIVYKPTDVKKLLDAMQLLP